MKNFKIKYIFSLLAIGLLIVACQDREIITIEDSEAPMLVNLSAQNLILDPNFPSNPSLTISWTPAKYTVPVEINYNIEISSTETFDKKFALGDKIGQSVTTKSFTNKQINDAAKLIGLVPSQSQKIYFRVISSVNGNFYSQVSNVTNLTVTPYLASPVYNYVDLYLIGAATAGGWDNVATNLNIYPLLKNTDKNIYTYSGFFKADGFKIIKNKGSYDVQYGLGTATNATSGTLDTGGGSGNIMIPSDGYYKLTINISTLTYTLAQLPNPNAGYDSISIIGTVNGNWNTDTQLKRSTFDTHVWTAKAVSLNEGVFKFRANNSWDVSWGAQSEFFGTAQKGGDNIPLSSEWIYDIYFNDATGDYTLIPVK